MLRMTPFVRTDGALMKILSLFLCIVLSACSGGSDSEGAANTVDAGDVSSLGDQEASGEVDGASSTDTEAVEDVSEEMNPGSDVVDDVQAQADAASPTAEYCEGIGMTSIPFDEGSGGYLFGDLAEDFRVTELYGETWSLRENWTGCESYIFFSFFEFQNADSQTYMENLWKSDLQEIIKASAENVHFFFISSESDPVARETRMKGLHERRAQAAYFLFPNDEEKRKNWESRIHLVTDRLPDVQGSVGSFVVDYMNYASNATPVDLGDKGQAYPPPVVSFAIGRDQRWDPTGNQAEYVGGPQNLKMTAYNSAFYNHRAELRAHLDAEENTTVYPLIDEMVTTRVFNKDASFPDAAAMDDIDTMELDVQVTCKERNPFACSEWDRIARISLCTEFDAEDPESCTLSSEIVRWITPYWRRGRRHWVLDASAFLGLVQEGGKQRFRIEMGPGWERATERQATMSVRLSNQNKGMKSRNVTYAFGGGSFNASYNENHPPFVFTPPEGSSRVELVTIISGHGQESGNNCAEWCNHMHEFSINDSDKKYKVAYTGMGMPFGCADRAGIGVVPGQWGNWSQSRAGWCPGLPVDTVRFDITEAVTLGAENTLSYEASFNGSTPAGGNISMSTYIISYED